MLNAIKLCLKVFLKKKLPEEIAYIEIFTSDASSKEKTSFHLTVHCHDKNKKEIFFYNESKNPINLIMQEFVEFLKSHEAEVILKKNYYYLFLIPIEVAPKSMSKADVEAIIQKRLCRSDFKKRTFNLFQINSYL